MTAKKHLDSSEVYKVYVESGRNQREAAKRLGISPASVALHVFKAEEGKPVNRTIEQELKAAKEEIKRLRQDELTDERVKEQILKVATSAVTPPTWLTRPTSKTEHFAGVPTLFASDWHFGEIVRPSEIGGVNEYNVALAKERARTFITKAIDLLRNHFKSGKYPGVVFALGGDMLSGDIHEELSETNELSTLPALLELSGVLTWCIKTLADEFGAVFVPCVTGNHGRMTRKPRAKRRNHTNFDWLLYQILAKRFEDDKRVTFYIPDGPDAYYRVHNVRYLLTHGDQFRGGDGMIGALGPISRGDKKKRARNGQTDKSFDVMLLGHWHQYIHLTRFIVNGSLKGYDEYADSNNFDIEAPQQALWITHPEHGITFRMPIFVQRGEKKERTEWVTLPANS
jgi:transposase-like protein